MFSGLNCAFLSMLVEKMLNSSPVYAKNKNFFFFYRSCFNIAIIEKKKATPESELCQRENYIAEKYTTF